MYFSGIIFTFLLLFSFALSDRCSYNYCYKEELHACQDSSSRDHCNNKNGLYITYREGTFSTAKHKCCQWKLEEVQQKYLYCVRNIRTANKKCTSESTKDYDLKYRTVDKCNTFSCE